MTPSAAMPMPTPCGLGSVGAAKPGRAGACSGELEGTANFNDGSFNNTRNGTTRYPVVADPKNAELNQLYLNYQPDAASRITLGRQRLVYDNQRFFGNVGWRQNEQTFDALDATRSFGNGFSLRYSYLDRVQRIFGDDHSNRDLGRWNLSTHLFSASHALGSGSLTGHAHFIDNQTLPAIFASESGPALCGHGGLADGSGWLATLELAQQDNHADGLVDHRRPLPAAGRRSGLRGYTGKLGFEQLSGDGRHAFQTTSHRPCLQWLGRCSTTPVNGLNDRYVSAGGPGPRMDGPRKPAGCSPSTISAPIAAAPTTAPRAHNWASLGSPGCERLVKYASYNADSLPATPARSGCSWSGKI
ncbi:MAG: hypothetical protein R3F18_02325 [Lysobacterales bacterium]